MPLTFWNKERLRIERRILAIKTEEMNLKRRLTVHLANRPVVPSSLLPPTDAAPKGNAETENPKNS